MADQLWRVRRGDQPLVATAIHDGHHLRPEVAALVALDDAQRLREEDPFTACWTDIAENRVVPLGSRFEVDLNRPPERAVYLTPDDAWGLHVWRVPPGEGVVARSQAIHRAFYELMTRILVDLEERYGRFVLLDLHSYNHRRAGPDGPPADPADNPVVNVGTATMARARWAPLVDGFIADLSATELHGAPLDVRENVRFGGGNLVRWVHRTFPRSGCGLAVEVKKVYVDEWTGEVDTGAVRRIGDALRSTIPGLLDSLDRCRP